MTAQVKEISNKGLQRKFTIILGKDALAQKMNARLVEIQKEAKAPGFRPGKVPMELVRKQHGPNARADILDTAISEATQKALEDRKLRPAMQPKIELVEMAEDKDLEFSLEVEILPEVTPGDFSKIALERPVTDVEEKLIDDAITRAAKSVH